MRLLPLPLTPDKLIIKRDRLRARLEKENTEVLIEQRLGEIINWEHEPDAVSRRIYKNLGLVFSEAELRVYVRDTMHFILRSQLGEK